MCYSNYGSMQHIIKPPENTEKFPIRAPNGLFCFKTLISTAVT